MTADRFGPVSAGEYTALSAVRPPTDGSMPVGDLAGRVAPEPPPRTGYADRPGRPERGARRESAGRPGTAGAARTRRPERPWIPTIPPQHGAWAFLIVPVLVGFAVAGGSGVAGWTFLVSWVCAYPVGYYGGRALTARVRRGSWTRLARRELSRAVPWAVMTAALGLPLAWTRPWLLLAALLLAALWGLGLWVAAQRGERSMANDLMLVAQAVAAVPLSVAVVAGPAALADSLVVPTASATAVIGAYLAGSVIHVKSVLREAGNPAYRRLNLGFHGVAMAASAVASPWWLLGFLPALTRAILMPAGLRPGVIGGVEAVVSVLMVLAAFLAI